MNKIYALHYKDKLITSTLLNKKPIFNGQGRKKCYYSTYTQAEVIKTKFCKEEYLDDVTIVEYVPAWTV